MGLFASPCPTILLIFRSKSTQQFSPLPPLCTFLNCALWSLYGISPVASQTLVLTVNAAGTAANAIYVTFFLRYSEPGDRKKLLFYVAGVLTFFATVTAVTLGAFDSSSIRMTFVGIIAVVVTAAMYASPLTVMWTVIKTESVQFMPFFLSLNVFFNAVAWTVYAVYIRDIYVGIPNVLGTILGTAQLLLYARYWKPESKTVEVISTSSRSASRKWFLDSPDKVSDEERGQQPIE